MEKRIQISGGILFLAFLVFTGCESAVITSSERNKELIRRVNKEVWNKGNLELIEELYSPDYVRHFLPDGSEIKGLDKLRDVISKHFKAFPDWTEKIELIVAEGNYVAIHFSSTGTNKGSFRNNPATGKQIFTKDMSIYRIVDGKIVEQWLLPNLLSLQQQLGIIPQSK